jgi:hypothetical protein
MLVIQLCYGLSPVLLQSAAACILHCKHMSCACHVCVRPFSGGYLSEGSCCRCPALFCCCSSAPLPPVAPLSPPPPPPVAQTDNTPNVPQKSEHPLLTPSTQDTPSHQAPSTPTPTTLYSTPNRPRQNRRSPNPASLSRDKLRPPPSACLPTSAKSQPFNSRQVAHA